MVDYSPQEPDADREGGVDDDFIQLYRPAAPNTIVTRGQSCEFREGSLYSGTLIVWDAKDPSENPNIVMLVLNVRPNWG